MIFFLFDSCANGKSLDQLVIEPFLLRTSASQTNFDRLISDKDGEKKRISFQVSHFD